MRLSDEGFWRAYEQLLSDADGGKRERHSDCLSAGFHVRLHLRVLVGLSGQSEIDARRASHEWLVMTVGIM